MPTEEAAPRFSIVTPCLNRAGTIEAAIRSVLDQGHPSVEHIVMDGGSTDGTREVLARYPHLRVVSEPDRNLYDAINKGLARTRGDWVGLLNSDDVYAPGAFAAAEAAMAGTDVELLLGQADFFAMRDGVEVVLRRLDAPGAVALSEANVIGNVTAMNAGFFHRSLLARLGGFDTRFPLAADKDFWLRLLLAAPRLRDIPALVYRYRSHPGSLTFAPCDLRDKLARHLLELTRTRLAELPPGSAGHAAYRRWHAWATGYRAALQARARQPGAALGTAWDGLRRDLAWPIRFLLRLPRHWRDRGQRADG